jgi:hypothetical protein
VTSRRRGMNGVTRASRSTCASPPISLGSHSLLRNSHQGGAAVNDLAIGSRPSANANHAPPASKRPAANRQALKEWTRDRVPLHWATSFGYQGLTLAVFAERRSDRAMARQAVDQIGTAEPVMREGGHAPHADYYAAQFSAAEALGIRPCD